jgi:hypothetical protein
VSEQTAFDGWAIVELFGHQKIAGFVTTQYFGTACMFRVDVPELPERERTLKYSERVQISENGFTYADAGTKVKQPAEPGYSRLLGPGAIYALNPCTEQTVREFIDRERKMPLVALDLPAARAKALAAPSDSDGDDYADDPDF